MRISFLVSDSRSGSTLLSKLIMQYIKNVVVTPEIGFNHLIKLKTIDKVNLEDLVNKNYFKNLNIDKDMLSYLLYNSKDTKDLICNLLKFTTKYKEHANDDAPMYIIKYSSRTFPWKYILEIFGKDTPIIFLYRDPRGTINSKLKTIRPYYSFENFAWGGSLLAAIQWYQYVIEAEKMKNFGVRLHEIQYENLVMSPEEELQKLASFLQLPIKNETTINECYFIPKQERKIHLNIDKAPLKERINAWQKELSANDIKAIESLLYHKMQEKGYTPLYNLSTFDKLSIIIKMLPSTFFRVSRHYLLHIFYKIKSIRGGETCWKSTLKV